MPSVAQGPSQATVEFRILGPVEVRVDGQTPELGPKQRALLAILLLNANRVVSTDRLVDEVWETNPPKSGADAVQVRISQLRKSLGLAGRAVVTRPPGYLLRVAADALDLHRFERLLAEAEQESDPGRAAAMLREALALWRGSALADAPDSSFTRAAAARLEELRMHALERRLDADLALGRQENIVGELQQLIAEHPLRERLRGQLMIALYRSGRQAEALRVYQQARRALVEGLGIEPSPPLRELQQAILRQDEKLAGSAVSPPEMRSILVVAVAEDGVAALSDLAESLGRRPPREVILTRIVRATEDLREASRALNEHRHRLAEQGVTARAAAYVSATPDLDALRYAAEPGVDLVLVSGSAGLLNDPVIQAVLAGAPCDVAVLLGAALRPGPVLAPFGGGEHDWSAIELGAWAAGAREVPLVLAGPMTDRGPDASRLLASASLVVQRALGVACETVLVEPTPEGLLHAASGAGLVVLGLPQQWRTAGLGPVRQALAERTESPCLLVRSGLRPGGLAPRESLTRFTWSLQPGLA